MSIDLFNYSFGNYAGIADKHEALYIFILSDASTESVIEKIEHQINKVDTVRNSVRRVHIKDRLKSFATLCENKLLQNEMVMSCIYMVGETIDFIPFDPSWQMVISEYGTPCTYIERHGDVFQLEWLKNYLTSTDYVNAVAVNNNTLCHTILGKTKSKQVSTVSRTSLNLLEWLDEHTKSDRLCVMHGISGLFKQLDNKTPSHVHILKGATSFEKIIEYCDRVDNLKKIEELDIIFSEILHPTKGELIVFGKDIKKCINRYYLKTLFCTEELFPKIQCLFGEKLNPINVVVVKSFGIDSGERLQTDFAGAIGVTHYNVKNQL